MSIKWLQFVEKSSHFPAKWADVSRSAHSFPVIFSIKVDIPATSMEEDRCDPVLFAARGSPG